MSMYPADHMEKKYVIAFLFDEDLKNVWLIEKQKPSWQKGLLNGIGGKTEPGETAIQAIVRELQEEAGIMMNAENLQDAGQIEGLDDLGDSYEVIIFTGVTTLALLSQEEEKIGQYELSRVSEFRYVENLQLLLQACLYKLTNESNYNRIILKYDIKP